MYSLSWLLGLFAGAVSAVPVEQQQQQPLVTDHGSDLGAEAPVPQLPLTEASTPIHGRFLHITGISWFSDGARDLSMLTAIQISIPTDTTKLVLQLAIIRAIMARVLRDTLDRRARIATRRYRWSMKHFAGLKKT